MLNRRSLIALPLLFALPALANQKQFFDIKDFEAAQKENKRIFVEVTAPWCPTCKAQKPIIDKLAALPENKDLVIFIVDFDTQKEELKRVNARSQSTLISYKGMNETGRLAGDTKEEAIAKVINSSK